MQRIGLWVRPAVGAAGVQPTRECWKAGLATSSIEFCCIGRKSYWSRH